MRRWCWWGGWIWEGGRRGRSDGEGEGRSEMALGREKFDRGTWDLYMVKGLYIGVLEVTELNESLHLSVPKMPLKTVYRSNYPAISLSNCRHWKSVGAL